MTLKEELQRQWDRQGGPQQGGKPKMKVYVAGSYQYRHDIAELVERIQLKVPFENTATWIRQGEEDDLLKEKGHDFFINLDRTDICRADVFLLVNSYHLSKLSTGKWVELGIAMELGLQIVVWGTLQDSLFIHGKDTIIIEDHEEDELIKALDIVSKVMRKAEQDIQDAYRTVGGVSGPEGRVGTAPGEDENRGEDAGARIQLGEVRPLSEHDGETPSRAERLGRAQAAAGEATPPHGPSVHQLK